MSRKKNKKHSKKSASAKGKETRIGNNPPHESILGRAVTHALSSGWVQNSGVGFLFIFVALIVAYMTKTQVKAAALTFAFAGTVFLWIAAGFVIKYASGDGDLLFKVNMSMLTNGVPPWYLRYQSPLGDTMAPMPIALFASVTNTKEIPLRLDSIGVRAQLNGGKWINFRYVNTIAGDVYWMYGGNLVDAGLLDLSGNGLDRLLLKPVAPHDTVRGWIFFDTKEPFPTADGDTVRFMWKAQDSTGEKYTFTSESSPVKTKVETPEDVDLAGAVFVFSRAHIDLSSAGIKFKKFDDVVIPIPNKKSN
jgi:hypothetical protein